MPDGPENLTLRMMRRMDEKLDRVLFEVASIKPRLTSLERQLAELRLDMVGIPGRLDRVDTRLDQVEYIYRNRIVFYNLDRARDSATRYTCGTPPI